MREDTVIRIKPPLGLDQFHLGIRFRVAVRFDKRQIGRRQFFFNDDGFVFGTVSVSADLPHQIICIIEMQAIRYFVQMLLPQVLARESELHVE